MGRPTELRTRVSRNVIFENEDLLEFQNLVGKDNVSRELRAMISKFLETQKKGEALNDRVNLEGSTIIESQSNNSVSPNLCISNNRDLRDFIDKTDDIETLAKVENNSLTLRNLAHNKKIDLCTLNRINKLKKQ